MWAIDTSSTALTFITLTPYIWVLIQGSVELIPLPFSPTLYCKLSLLLQTIPFPSILCLQANHPIRVWWGVASDSSCFSSCCPLHPLSQLTWPALHLGQPGWCGPVVPAASRDGQKPAAVWAGLPAGQVPPGSGAPLHCFPLLQPGSRGTQSSVSNRVLHSSHGCFFEQQSRGWSEPTRLVVHWEHLSHGKLKEIKDNVPKTSTCTSL